MVLVANGEAAGKHSQLSTVQRLVNVPMLDGLHSLLWVINLHLGVLQIPVSIHT